MRNAGLMFLLVIFGLPTLEIYTLFKVADAIGWWLLAWLLASGIFGWVLIKEESLAVFGRLAVAVQNGQSPFVALWDSGRTILAGILLIFPGVLSDFVALVLLLWPNRVDVVNDRGMPDDGVIEGEVRVVDVVQIEVKSESRS